MIRAMSFPIRLAKATPLALVLLAGFLLSACGVFSPRTGPLAISASSAGIAATDAALRSYDNLEGLYSTELRSRRTGDLLTVPGHPDYARLATLSPEEKQIASEWAASIETRRQAARNPPASLSRFQSPGPGRIREGHRGRSHPAQ